MNINDYQKTRDAIRAIDGGEFEFSINLDTDIDGYSELIVKVDDYENIEEFNFRLFLNDSDGIGYELKDDIFDATAHYYDSTIFEKVESEIIEHYRYYEIY